MVKTKSPARVSSQCQLLPLHCLNAPPHSALKKTPAWFVLQVCGGALGVALTGTCVAQAQSLLCLCGHSGLNLTMSVYK